MSGKKHPSADDVPLIPMDDFKQAVRKILSSTKAASDRELAEFQAGNLRRREAKERH